MEEIKVEIEDYSKDQSRYLREVFEAQGIDRIVYPEKKVILAEGILPEDADRYPLGIVGEHGVVRIENRSNLTVIGNGTKLYNDDYVVFDLDTDGDGFSDADRDGDGKVDDAGYLDRSHRAFYKVITSQNITIDGIQGESNNHTPVHKAGRPEYETQKEHEHFVRLSNVKNFTLKNFVAKYIWGDAVYISGNDTEDVEICDGLIDWTGRQAIAITGGRRIWIHDVKAPNGRRGFIDLESPLPYHITDGLCIERNYTNTHLHAFPMAGMGVANNVLVQNNRFNASSVGEVRATNGAIKKNYVYSNNVNESDGAAYTFNGVHNILIEDNVGDRKAGKESVVTLMDCTGEIHIRNNKWKKLNDNTDSLLITLRGGTKPENVKVYGNTENIKFLIHETQEVLDVVQYVPTEQEASTIPFEVLPWLLAKYNAKTGVIPDVVEASPSKAEIEANTGKEYNPWLNFLEEMQIDPAPVEPENPNTMNKVQNFRLGWKSETNIRVEWDKVEGAVEYIITRQKNGGKIHTSTTSGTSLNLIGGNVGSGVWDLTIKYRVGNLESEITTLQIEVGKPETTEPELPETPTPEVPPVVEPKPETPTPVIIENDEQAVSVAETLLAYLKKNLNGF